MNNYLRLKSSNRLLWMFWQFYLSQVLLLSPITLLVLGARVLCDGVRVWRRSNDAHPQRCVLGAAQYLLHGLRRAGSAVSAWPQRSVQASLSVTLELALLCMYRRCPSRDVYRLNLYSNLQNVWFRDSKSEVWLSPRGINRFNSDVELNYLRVSEHRRNAKKIKLQSFQNAFVGVPIHINHEYEQFVRI